MIWEGFGLARLDHGKYRVWPNHGTEFWVWPDHGVGSVGLGQGKVMESWLWPGHDMGSSLWGLKFKRASCFF